MTLAVLLQWLSALTVHDLLRATIENQNGNRLPGWQAEFRGDCAEGTSILSKRTHQPCSSLADAAPSLCRKNCEPIFRLTLDVCLYRE
jgi:hypothetical protein